MDKIRVYKKLDENTFEITDFVVDLRKKDIAREEILSNEPLKISRKDYLKKIQEFKKSIKNMDNSKNALMTRAMLSSRINEETSAIGYDAGMPYPVKVTKSGGKGNEQKGTIKLTINNTTTTEQTVIVGDAFNTIASKVYPTVLPAGVIIGGTFGNLTLFNLKVFTQSIPMEFDRVHIQSATPNFFGGFTYRHALGNLFNLPPVEFDVELGTDITKDTFRTDVRRRGYDEPYYFVMSQLSAILMGVPAQSVCTVTFTVPRAGTSVILNEVNQVNC